MTFWGKDLRGLAIVFPQAVFDHATKERGHLDVVKGTWATVMAAFESSKLVIGNEPLPEELRQDAPRTAQERYISWMPDWNVHLVVPVKIHNAPLVLRDVKIDPPVRIAATVYTSIEIPPGNILWQWQPKS